METVAYARCAGEKCTAVSWVRNDKDSGCQTPPDGWEELRHGDIMYEAEGYRGSDTWIVIEYVDGKREIKNISDSSAYAEITTEVSKRIEDPLDFYSEVLDSDLYQGVTTIFLDPTAHQDILQKMTGGRPVHESRCIWWTTYNDGAEIAIPISRDHPRGGEALLDNTTLDVYLTDSDGLDRDPEILRAQTANRKAHEETATAYFRRLQPGSHVSLVNFPEEHPGSHFVGGGTFQSANPAEGQVTSVIIKDFSHILTFTPRLVPFEIGPYGGVRVWAADNLGMSFPLVLMLSLPGDK